MGSGHLGSNRSRQLNNHEQLFGHLAEADFTAGVVRLTSYSQCRSAALGDCLMGGDWKCPGFLPATLITVDEKILSWTKLLKTFDARG